MAEAALLMTALLFGGTTLYSFGFAAFVFNALPAETAGPVIRRAFPHFYLFVLGVSAAAAMLIIESDAVSGVVLALIAAITVVARQILMPAINRATDSAARAPFKALHTLSVVITLGHIVAAATVLLRLTSCPTGSRSMRRPRRPRALPSSSSAPALCCR